MSATAQTSVPFLDFLRSRIENGAVSTEDTLASILPLMRQVVQVHESGRVAPLKGIEHLKVEGVQIWFEAAHTDQPALAWAKLSAIDKVESLSFEITASERITDDVTGGTTTSTNLRIAKPGTEITSPSYLQGYVTWEHQGGHHDPLTDIFSLGMLLASLALGLDLSDADDLESFAGGRSNLFNLNASLHPALAKAIVRMTEVHRHKRARDLAGILSSLENYRDQAVDVAIDLARIRGFNERTASSRRQILLERLRERLFEISRRNRLLHFKPSLNSLNLTVASVPLLFDARAIRPDQLLTWQADFASRLLSGAAIPLGRYLRFEDAPYIAGVLDHVIAESKRDHNEFGFSQLRLVICFLRWHNLKETKDERIESPLLLLTVQLTKKKGVRDAYVLQANTTEAVVNPTLRFHLRELYGIKLPESLDLAKTSLDEFHSFLAQQIQTSEPAVALNKVDKPHIKLIQESAKRRLDQYQRRLSLQRRGARSFQDLSYSYDHDNFSPLGLKLFQLRVRPVKAQLGDIVTGKPRTRDFAVPEPPSSEQTRNVAQFQEGTDANPYSWDFDLCSVTLGNFKYRKMSLVRDYDALVDNDLTNPAFESIFSLKPKAAAAAPTEVPALDKRFPVVACDPTQAAAIAQAGSGQSFIIQGPPGTGKSQTITNLIADYVAAGKRVLFVCEKRAAIDVVHQRLKQQGLHELCCLIHDSQEDKKAFIQDLKQTYETFLAEAGREGVDWPRRRAEILAAIRTELEPLEQFDAAMQAVPEHIGIPLRQLIQRRIEISEVTPRSVQEALPAYRQWTDHRDAIGRLADALREVEKSGIYARHPLSLLNGEVLKADSPQRYVAARLENSNQLLGAVNEVIQGNACQGHACKTLADVDRLVAYAESVRFLAERDLCALFDPKSALMARLLVDSGTERDAREALAKARDANKNWNERLPQEELAPALDMARSLTGTFSFLKPAWWRLRRVLTNRYNFGLHAVKPSWIQVLESLGKEYAAEASLKQEERKAREKYGVAEVENPDEQLEQFVERVQESQKLAKQLPEVAKALHQAILKGQADAATITTLGSIRPTLETLDRELDGFLASWKSQPIEQLQADLDRLEEALDLLPEFLPCLAELQKLPPQLAEAFRMLPLGPLQLEAGMADQSYEKSSLQDRQLSRFSGAVKDRHRSRLERLYREWQESNARCIRSNVRDRFLKNVAASSRSNDGLHAEQKAFKKNYSQGRKELEHEFGKTMRYRSIRDLLQDPETGKVIPDLKPVWLMSPLSVSDTLPLDSKQLDVVIFDEASQIPLEEGLPAIFRADQVIVVGDQMQLPPTTFFSARGSEDDLGNLMDGADPGQADYDLSSNSFLAYSARTLPSTMLGWHYRSRFESLISFSNARFYEGRLLTVPESTQVRGLGTITVADAAEGGANVQNVVDRSISFHYAPKGVYEDRRNPFEAAYIAHLVRGLLAGGSKLSIGIVAFSEAQQGEIESALTTLADADADFRDRLEREYEREEDGQYQGLLVKNLENIQGDERDVVILSICYGKAREGPMRMGFGPINQSGGEKRLNVAFSRAKRHMVVVSSIKYPEITNEYNDGANCLRNYLRYAEAVSAGDLKSAERVLDEIQIRRESTEAKVAADAVTEQLAQELRRRGYEVDLNVGQSKLTCDLAVRRTAEPKYLAAVFVDTMERYRQRDILARDLMAPGLLKAFGWRVYHLLAKDWYEDRGGAAQRLERFLCGELDEVAEKGPILPPPALHGPGKSAEPEPAPAQVAGKQFEPFPTMTLTGQAGKARRFEYQDDHSSKFWEITVDVSRTVVRFGRAGTDGQTMIKDFTSAEDAKRDGERLIRQKLAKGYQERT